MRPDLVAMVADGVYVGGGFLVLVLLIVLVVLLFRRY